LAVYLDNGTDRGRVILDSPSYGLYIPPKIWSSQSDHEEGTVLAVLASEEYDAEEYLRTYEEFLRFRIDQENA